MSTRSDVLTGRANGRVPADGEVTRWRGAVAVAGWAALASVALTFVQLWIYVQWPPPDTVEGFYALFADNPLLGLLSLDLLYIVNNLLVLLVYLGLFLVLRRRYPSTVSIGLLLGAVGMAAYMASNTLSDTPGMIEHQAWARKPCQAWVSADRVGSSTTVGGVSGRSGGAAERYR